MGNKIVLEMEHITKRFPGVLALDDVSIQAYAGEILALCGENGAGKSTLMKILSGSYPESSYEGTIAVEGQACHFANPLQSERMGIEMIYQEVSMHLDSTIAENIFMGSWLRKKNMVDWQGMNSESKKYIEMVGLDAEPTDIVRKLSTSQQQMVSIARALSKEPKILVLD
ncbi:MAG: ATP-binding cassette domain-containing protein, partial [Lachnospiraceae bacterium]|nr:ATP-binding cassette domain-containing protein [Lachnospiraceae bacterium]